MNTWDQASDSTLSFMNCDEKKELSESEFDFEPGKVCITNKQTNKQHFLTHKVVYTWQYSLQCHK